MNLPKDPMLLLSVVNTKLRDQYTTRLPQVQKTPGSGITSER